MEYIPVDSSGRRVASFPAWALLVSAGLGFLGGIVGSALTRDRAGMFGPRGSSELPLLASPGRAGDAGQTHPAVGASDPVVGVVERASPAVVSVIVSKDLPKLEDVVLDPFSDPFFRPSPFRFRLRRPSGDVEKREVGGGTGFVVDESGMILTNRHVVADEEEGFIHCGGPPREPTPQQGLESGSGRQWHG